MAAQVIGTTETGHDIWAGTLAERTTLGIKPALTKYQVIGGSLYESDGSNWVVAESGGGTMAGDQFASGTLLDGNAVIIPMAGARLGCVVWTEPVAGDTVTVSYSLDGTTYYEWPHGAVTSASADKSDTLNGAITHIKFQRTGGAGVTSTYGVTR